MDLPFWKKLISSTSDIGEYIFLARDEDELRLFFKNFSDINIGSFYFFVVIIPTPGIDIRTIDWGAFVMKSPISRERLIAPLSEEDMTYYSNLEYKICLITKYSIPKGFIVKFRCMVSEDELLVKRIVEIILGKAKLLGFNPVIITNSQIDITQARPKMRQWRMHRANLFKEIKDQHPSFSMAAVADRATEIAYERIRAQIDKENPNISPHQIEQKTQKKFIDQYSSSKESFSAEDVRNDYRAMGWTWEDSRRQIR